MVSKYNFKQILISIFIGACVAFFSTLFQSLSDFLHQNSAEIIGGTVTAFHYMVKTYRAE